MSMQANATSNFFHQYKPLDIDVLVSTRNGETKLGQQVAVPADENLVHFLDNSQAIFVVIGIAEDIGVMANHGRAGASGTWNFFLSAFLNMQANKFTNAETIAVIGYFSFEDLYAEISRKSVTAHDKIAGYRHAVTIIDDAVAEMIRVVISHKKIPVVIGGGHNNSFPLIKGAALALNSRKGINCINLDAHLDFRATEGRHSGNGFRYAKEGGFLNRYYVIGVHQNYLNDSIVHEILNHPDIDFITHEEIFIRKKKSWHKALRSAVRFAGRRFTGVEVDLDSLSDVASSAATPCGITTREVLQYIDHLAIHCNVGYLHICEGIASSDNTVGKLIAYLVSQFVSSFSNEHIVRRRGRIHRWHRSKSVK